MGDVLILFEDFDKAEEMGMKFVPGAWAKIVDEMKDLWMEKSDYRNAADWKTRALMHRVETLGEKSTDSKLRVAFYSKEEWCTSYDRMKKVFQDTRTKFNVTAQTPGIAETAHALKAGSTSLTKFVEDNKPKPF